MATIPHPVPADTCGLDYAALETVAGRAYVMLGACGGRLAKAVALVRSGAVTIVRPGYALVQSQSDPQTVYHVNPTCGCPDALHQAERGRCKHRLAAALAHRLVRPQPTSPLPSAARPPLPEAPASINVRLTLQGREVQLTLRDTDEARLLARLAAILPPAAAPAPAASAPPALPSAPPEGWCATHTVQMTPHTNAKGTWWSHKVNGAWCKGTSK